MHKTYRKDYTPSSFLIKNTNLIFYIYEDYTLVKSKIEFYQNQNNKKDSIVLDGENLELIDITLNGAIPKYTKDETGLKLFNLPKRFQLEVTTKIYPRKNTKLIGLYKSKSILCTQCEAHGFRHITYFLDRPDILSTWNVEINTYKDFSAKLSNGNLVKTAKNYAKWFDPYPKPCYLFALVVGDLVKNSDTFITRDNNEVKINIWCEAHNINKTNFAIKSLKQAMLWDEKRFNLSYDLELYNIVAVDDFNLGAMENKGLNIFNSKFILANDKTATDDEYLDIEAVIGHEYFHNWTGNRVTCKSWFELSLKEGLTVFRDQEFSGDLRFRELKRINDVDYLRTYQFAEDRGKLSHPVRPESYLVMDNFYTVTIYEKGAEIIRMLETLVGKKNFLLGFENYIKKYDGKAATIDDFIKQIIAGNKIDYDKFMLWYSEKGVNVVTIEYELNEIRQNDNRITPIKYAIFDKDGNKIKQDLLVLDNMITSFDFDKYKNHSFSWNRDFSAPIELIDNLTNKDRVFLVKNDDNAFVRFDNMQKLYLNFIINKNEDFIAVLTSIINKTDIKTLTLLLNIPSEKAIYNHIEVIDIDKIFTAREKLLAIISTKFESYFLEQYNLLNDNKYKFNNQAIIKRKFKNQCLQFLSITGQKEIILEQYNKANCMTDRFASFKLLLDSEYREQIINDFYNTYKNDELVINKWFAAIANNKNTTATDINNLINNQSFDIRNPNKVRSLIGSFSNNYKNFHQIESYKIFKKIILQLNNINPQIGAKLISVFANYNKFNSHYRNLQLEFINNIKQHPKLSNDISEIITNILN